LTTEITTISASLLHYFVKKKVLHLSLHDME